LRGKGVVVGLSGGVDSAVAAARLVDAGARVAAVTLLTATEADCVPGVETACCTRAEADTAQTVAHHLGIRHYRFDERDRFREKILAESVQVISRGGTPSVCPLCNARFKLRVLAEKARILGFEFIATGHYARVETRLGRTRLLRGTVRERDQSYFLYAVPLEVRERLILPLGETEKITVRAEALRRGLRVHDKPASQDLCPALAGDLEPVLKKAAPEMTLSGPILDHHGRERGTHGGLFRYTLGQRRGLGLGGGTGEPLYVTGKDLKNRALIIGPEDRLWSREMTVELEGPIADPLPSGLSCQPRRNHPGAPADVTWREGNTVGIRFLTPQRALTPGQAAVFYLGDEVVAGGTIWPPSPAR
ncbi:tRNA 2-thiouridine(34) synthase MnmA, partial [bacterium]|nr:tRNA 2-thiouridine(34) synthase MnmA [bacterium]